MRFLVVVLTMHTMVLERTGEIGILKALGSSRLDIVRLLLGETLVLALLGGISGIAFTFLVETVLKETTPTLQILITPGWLGGALLLAMAGAAAGAGDSAVGGGGIDPGVALAYAWSVRPSGEKAAAHPEGG